MLTKILSRGANALKNALRGIDFGKLQTSDVCVDFVVRHTADDTHFEAQK